MATILYHWYCPDCGMEHAEDIGDCPTCGTAVCRLERESKPDEPKPGDFYVRCGSDVEVAPIFSQKEDSWSVMEDDGTVVTSPGQMPESVYSDLVDSDLTKDQWEKVAHSRRQRAEARD